MTTSGAITACEMESNYCCYAATKAASGRAEKKRENRIVISRMYRCAFRTGWYRLPLSLRAFATTTIRAEYVTRMRVAKEKIKWKKTHYMENKMDLFSLRLLLLLLGVSSAFIFILIFSVLFDILRMFCRKRERVYSTHTMPIICKWRSPDTSVDWCYNRNGCEFIHFCHPEKWIWRKIYW